MEGEIGEAVFVGEGEAAVAEEVVMGEVVEGEVVATDEASAAAFTCFPGSGTGDKFICRRAGATPPINFGQQWDVTSGAAFTMCARVRVESARERGKGNKGRILSKRSGNAGWEFVVPRYTGHISFYGNGRHENIGKTQLDDGAWHHVAVVYGGTAGGAGGWITAYLDGNSDGSVAFGTITPDPSVALMAGARYPQQDPFQGEFQEVKVYPRALDAIELRRIAMGERKEVEMETGGSVQIAGTYDTLVFCIFRASYVITATADPGVVRAQVYLGDDLKGAWDMYRSASDTRVWEGVFPPTIYGGAPVRWEFDPGYRVFDTTAPGKPPRLLVKRLPGAPPPGSCCAIA